MPTKKKNDPAVAATATATSGNGKSNPDLDRELLRSMLAGDEDALAALYRRRQGSIYRFAL